jgi:hypothetical protein
MVVDAAHDLGLAGQQAHNGIARLALLEDEVALVESKLLDVPLSQAFLNRTAEMMARAGRVCRVSI